MLLSWTTLSCAVNAVSAAEQALPAPEQTTPTRINAGITIHTNAGDVSILRIFRSFVF
jgi:hypothetical protein